MAVRRVERLSLSTEFRIDKDPDLDKKQPAIRINNHKPPLNHCVGCEVEVLEVVVRRRNRCGRAEKADCQFEPPIGQLHGSAKKETDRERERDKLRDKQPHLLSLLRSARLILGCGWFLHCLSFGYLF